MERFYFIDPKSGWLMMDVNRNSYQEACWDFELKYKLSVKVLINSGKLIVEKV